MGLLKESIRAVAPRRLGTPVAAVAPTWQEFVPQASEYSLEQFAREGYGKSEIIFAAIEERRTSVSKPNIRPVTIGEKGSEPVHRNHDLAKLLHRPNPGMTRYGLVSSIEIGICTAGNAFVEKVRSRAGRVVELWPVRPDRVRIIPGPDGLVAGYIVTVGGVPYPLPANDMIHLRTPKPFGDGDYWGMPPMAPAALRIDIDSWMRQFVAAFFTNGGAPLGILSVNSTLSPDDREEVRHRFGLEYGGPRGWHRLMVLEQGEAKYQQMGLPLGRNGLIIPELEEINEARLVMPFGVPLSLIGTRLGQGSSSYANRKSDREEYTVETVVPELEFITQGLTLGLAHEFTGVDAIEIDEATVPAMQEDRTAKHDRVRKDLAAGIITQPEARVLIGMPEEPAGTGRKFFFIPSNVIPIDAETLLPIAPEPEPEEDIVDGEFTEEDPNADDADDADDGKQAKPDTKADTEQRAASSGSDAPRTGVIVCLRPTRPDAARLALPGYESPDELHLTLGFLGKLDVDVTPETLATVRAALAGFATNGPAVLEGAVSGIGRFSTPNGIDAVYASVDCPELPTFRERLVETLRVAGIEVDRTHGFTPHMTLAYVGAEEPSPISRLDAFPVSFHEVWLWAGETREAWSLGGDIEEVAA